MTKEDIDLVRLALSAYHTKTVYPGCVEAFDRIVIEMGSVDKTAKEIVVDALRRDQARRKNEYIKHFERQEAFERIVQEKEMPTPMTIEMEADERQALDDFETGVKKVIWSRGSYEKFYIDDFFDDDTIKTIRAALQSPRVPDAMFRKLGSLIKAVDGGTFENDPHDAIIDAAIRTLSSPRVPVIEILDTVLEQAEDDGLWFNAKYASEAYLQQELRRLHAVIERAYAELQKGN